MLNQIRNEISEPNLIFEIRCPIDSTYTSDSISNILSPSNENCDKDSKSCSDAKPESKSYPQSNQIWNLNYIRTQVSIKLNCESDSQMKLWFKNQESKFQIVDQIRNQVQIPSQIRMQFQFIVRILIRSQVPIRIDMQIKFDSIWS